MLRFGRIRMSMCDRQQMEITTLGKLVKDVRPFQSQ
jgi:hypothetical protein